MAFGVTDGGFNRMLESDIKAAVVRDLAPIFGVDPSTTNWPTADDEVSQIADPFCRQLGLAWEQLENLAQGGDPNQAAGTLLDALLAQNNIPRLEASLTEVLAALSGDEGTTVPAGTQVSVATTGALFEAEDDAEITKDSLLRADVLVSTLASIGTPYTVTVNSNVVPSGTLSGSDTVHTIAHKLLEAVNAESALTGAVQAVYTGTVEIEVDTVASLTLYRLTIDGVNHDYTSDASATDQEIVDGLVAAVNSGSSGIVAEGLTSSTLSLAPAVSGTDWVVGLSANLVISTLDPVGFSLEAEDLETAFTLDVDSRMEIATLYSPQTYVAMASGRQEAPAGTLTQIETPISGLDAVTNFLDGDIGREVESDDEARVRRLETLPTGTGPVTGILSRLRRIDIPGVTTLKVYENIDDNPDAQGRPGHSVEVLVVGGSDKAVAEAIWAARDSGIAPFGNINSDGTVDPDGDGTGITIEDSNGDNQVVHFSRPETLYGFLDVTRTLYDEEDYPDNGDEAIKAALVAYGNSLTMGQDLINQRFEAAGRYSSPGVFLPGLRSLAIQIAVGHDPDDAPIGDDNPEDGDIGSTTSDISVGVRTLVLFDTSRVTVS